MSEHRARLVGSGYAVPDAVRGNDDPVFAWLREHNPAGMALFQGYVQRRVLAAGEDLMTIMRPAAQAALADARTDPAEIDLLLGAGSVSDYDPPNALSRLHAELGLSARCWPVAIANDFSNFNAGLLFAEAMIRAGRARKVLVCVGTNWSRHVDYQTAQAASAADGAGAAVVAATASPGWRLVDHEVLAATRNYGSMTMQASIVTLNPPAQGYSALQTPSTFQISADGAAAFRSFGVEASPKAVLALLARHRLRGSDISLITHQASSVLSTAWANAIQPAQYIGTLTQYGNMTAANIPVNLAWGQRNGGIAKDHLVLFALGPDMHAHALLLARY